MSLSEKLFASSESPANPEGLGQAMHGFAGASLDLMAAALMADLRQTVIRIVLVCVGTLLACAALLALLVLSIVALWGTPAGVWLAIGTPIVLALLGAGMVALAALPRTMAIVQTGRDLKNAWVHAAQALFRMRRPRPFKI